MKTSLLKAVVCVTLVFASVLNADIKAQNKFVTNDVMTGELLTSKIVYRNDGLLHRYIKHDFKYDDQNRAIEKETFKWNNRKEEWVPCYKISFTYAVDQIEMSYAKWNAGSNAYNEAQERSVYELNGSNVPVACRCFKWDDKNDEWMMARLVNYEQSDILVAANN